MNPLQWFLAVTGAIVWGSSLAIALLALVSYWISNREFNKQLRQARESGDKAAHLRQMRQALAPATPLNPPKVFTAWLTDEDLAAHKNYRKFTKGEAWYKDPDHS